MLFQSSTSQGRCQEPIAETASAACQPTAAAAASLVHRRIPCREPGERTYRHNPERVRYLRQLGQRDGASVAVLPGGLSVHRPGGPRPPVGGGVRGQIRGFSRASRRRMIRLLQELDTESYALVLVTLTTDDDHALADLAELKADVQAWQKRLERRYGELVGGLIRLEHVERKSGRHVGRLAPHWHILTFWRSRPDIETLRRWCWANWSGQRVDVVEATNRAGSNRGRLLHYLSKYVAKSAAAPVDRITGEQIWTGRAWSAFGALPRLTIAVYRVSGEAYAELCARVSRYGKSIGSWYLGAVSPLWYGYAIIGDGLLLCDSLLDGLDYQATG